MKISELPEEIREKALEYQRRNNNPLFKKDTDDLEDAFNWYKSEEGEEYWLEFYDKIAVPLKPKSNKENILLTDLKETFDNCLEIAIKKNADYAGGESFTNFLNAKVVGVSVQRGILVRIMDKISRISNLIDNEAQVENESIFDTLDDLINYTAILKSTIKNDIK